MDPLLRQTIKQRYVVEKGPLGETGEADAGGWSDVYLARDQDVGGRRVILKFPKEALLEGRDGAHFRARFQREIATLLASGEGFPGVVPVLDAGEHAGRPYCVLMYIGGGSLEGRLTRREASRDGTVRRVAVRQTPAEIAAWLPRVARSIDTVHRRGIVHRDIKPANILFGDGGTPYLSDFGIARLAEGGETTSGLTGTSLRNAFFTPGYESPEFIEGLPADFGYDHYALAVVVFRALTGRLPHWPTDPRVEDRHRALASRRTREDAEDVRALQPQISARVAAVVAKALSRRQLDRYPNCEAFAAAFAAAAGAARELAPDDGAPLDATRRAPPPAPDAGAAAAAAGDDRPAEGGRGAQTTTPQAPRAGSRRRRVVVAGVVAVVVVVGVIALATGPFSGTRGPSAGAARETAQGPTPPPISPPSAAPTPPAAAMTDATPSPVTPPSGAAMTEAPTAPPTPPAMDGPPPIPAPLPTPPAPAPAVPGAMGESPAATPAPTPTPTPAAAPTAPGAKPAWAKTSPEQDAYSAQAGLPVWHEMDLGGGRTLRFVLIPPGTFTMGSPTTEEGRVADETAHEVTLARGYYVSITEVTNGQYRRWKQAHDSGTYRAERLNDDMQPVVWVSHDDATAFAAWLSAQDGGRSYRLPTEAEWEYACRAGTPTARWWGEAAAGAQGRASVLDPASKAKFGFSREAFGFDDGHRTSAPVGTFAPNGWGLYDMLGNVWEWCADRYGAYPSGRVQDPPGPSTGSRRVLRGGSWYYGPGDVRSAERFGITLEYRSDHSGFRVVMDPPSSWMPPTPAPEVSAAMEEVPTSTPTSTPTPAATPTAAGSKPAWAKTSPKQDAYAAKAGLPVSHEADLGGGETLRFVLVPPGTFTMGSPTTEEGHQVDETAYEVTLTRGYYVSIGEVTNAQYRRWKGAHESGTKFFSGETQPVVEVSHADATGYAAWLSAQDGGRTYRLPTEAEWEYACRAGTTTPFWFGATITPEQANYDGDLSYGRGPKGASRKRATPLGTFAPNGWGLYDVHGNVWEWCADWYGAYPAGRVQDPPGPSTGSERVRRGGSWGDDPDFVRSANRLRRSPGSRDYDAGFRLVLVAPSVSTPPAATPQTPAAMGEATAPTSTAPGPTPAWAKTSPEQDAYATKAGLPVWHETDLGGGETLRFVLVPPGTFTMGSPTTEEGRDADETAHEVELARPYYVSIGEVTNGQYRRWKWAHDSGAKFNGGTQSVVSASHADATGYAAWLSAQDGGRTYRLPTEAEWEYACRAGTTTPFWFGATITPEQANYDGNFTYGGGPNGRYRTQTTPLGTFAPNGWGLYDMHGNVWEWCADWYGAYPSGRIQDPPGPSTGSGRVLRGGSWRLNPDRVRSAERAGYSPGLRDLSIGFRVVLGPALK